MNHIWDPSITRLIEGTSVRLNGSVVPIVGLIQQRWGWPRSAAKTAAWHIKSLGESGIWVDSGDPGPLGNKAACAKRLAQQVELFHSVPSLIGELCTGLVGRVFQSAEHADHVTDCVVIRFANPIDEHGLLRGVVDEVAKRLGIPADRVRDAVEVDRDSEPGLVSVLVKNEREL